MSFFMTKAKFNNVNSYTWYVSFIKVGSNQMSKWYINKTVYVSLTWHSMNTGKGKTLYEHYTADENWQL